MTQRPATRQKDETAWLGATPARRLSLMSPKTEKGVRLAALLLTAKACSKKRFSSVIFVERKKNY